MSQMDKFGLHEVMHMSLFLAEAVDEQLLEHEQVKSRPEWLALVETASDALHKLYTATAQVDHRQS